jgi:two-component system, NtrC family, sensor kinase
MAEPTQQFHETVALYQTVHVVRGSPVVFIGNPAGMLVVLAVLRPGETWLSTLAPVFILTLLVIPILLRWLRLRKAPPPKRVRRRSLWHSSLYSGVLGLAWLIIYLAVQPRMSEETVGLLVATLYVMAIGAAAAFAAVPSVCLPYAIPVMTAAPLTLMLYGRGLSSPDFALLGGFTVAFGIVLWSGRSSFRDYVWTLNDRSTLLDQKTAEVDRRRITEEALSKSIGRLQETQDQLVEQEKLASLGQLVAGVAHEINTPVGIALTGASALHNETKRLRQMADDGQARKSDVQRYFALAEETAELIALNCGRAADLVQGFKQVAVDQASEARREVALAAYLREVLASLRPKLKSTSHTVEIDCPFDIVMDTYPGCISQILTNFINNSLMHAFEEESNGVMTITARMPDRDHVEIIYRDNGRGIPLDLQGRIFEPFYTTKRGQGGSGLGLHIVYNLVHSRLQGRLTLESAPGQGSAFIMLLPRVTPRREPPSRIPAGVETIAVP